MRRGFASEVGPTDVIAHFGTCGLGSTARRREDELQEAEVHDEGRVLVGKRIGREGVEAFICVG